MSLRLQAQRRTEIEDLHKKFLGARINRVTRSSFESTRTSRCAIMHKPFRIKGRKGYFLHIPIDNGKTSIRKIGDSLREANANWEKMLSASESTKPDTSSDPPVVLLVSKYCDWMTERVNRDQLAKATMTRRIVYLASFIKSIDTQLRISELKVFHVTEWLESKKTWNANTQYYASSAIKRVFNWCRKEGRIASNPVEFLSVEKGGSRDYLVDDKTLGALREGASDRRFKRPHVIAFRTLLTVLSLSGCRPSEVASVRVEDWYNDRWILRNHKTAKKTRRARVVFLCPCLRTLTRIAAGNRKKGPLFMCAPGEAWTYTRMRVRFERLRKRLKLDPKLVLYSFRHTSITNALMAEVDVATVAEVHGTSIQMIQQSYGHLCQHSKHLNQAVFKMAKARRNKPTDES